MADMKAAYDADVVKFRVLQKTKALGMNTERSLFVDAVKQEVRMRKGNREGSDKVWECSSFVKMENSGLNMLSVVLKDTTSRATHREKKKILTFDNGDEREKFKILIERAQDSKGASAVLEGGMSMSSLRMTSSPRTLRNLVGVSNQPSGMAEFEWIQSVVSKVLLSDKEQLHTMEGSVVYTCRSAGEEDLIKGIFFFTNYRLGFIPMSLLRQSERGDDYKNYMEVSYHSNSKQIRRSLQAMVTIPLLLISTVSQTSLQTGFSLSLKDLRTATFHFNKSSAWVQTIMAQISKTCFSEDIEKSFAFIMPCQDLQMMANNEEESGVGVVDNAPSSNRAYKTVADWKAVMEREYCRQGICRLEQGNFGEATYVCENGWRMVNNTKFDKCPTYPAGFVVPSEFSEAALESVLAFRSKQRMPALSWLHPNGASLSRSAQPLVGMKNKQCKEDKELLNMYKVRAANAWFDDSSTFENPLNESQKSENVCRSVSAPKLSSPSVVVARNPRLSSVPGPARERLSMSTSGEDFDDAFKYIYIYDARGTLAAMGNKTQGRGFETESEYSSAKIVFCNIGNIHVMRNSIESLSAICAPGSVTDEDSDWLTKLQSSGWLGHVRGVLAASLKMALSLEKSRCSALCHCSDGWDRTGQMLGITQIILDPYFRTIEGFAVLIEKDFLQFGYKFQVRCGHASDKHRDERSPILLQFLDCVHQVMLQFPDDFEYTQELLVFTADHLYSGLFGNFFCLCEKEREEIKLKDRTPSVWIYILGNAAQFQNPHYRHASESIPTGPTRKTVPLWINTNPKNIRLWDRYFLRYDANMICALNISCDYYLPFDEDSDDDDDDFDDAPAITLAEAKKRTSVLSANDVDISLLDDIGADGVNGGCV